VRGLSGRDPARWSPHILLQSNKLSKFGLTDISEYTLKAHFSSKLLCANTPLIDHDFSQVIKQRFGCDQIGDIEVFRKPLVDRHKGLSCFGDLALINPQTAK